MICFSMFTAGPLLSPLKTAPGDRFGNLSHRYAAWPLFSLLVLAAVSSARAAEVTLTEHEGGVRVEVDGELFTDYLIDAAPKPILWPVIGPSGAAMTRAYPMATVEGEKQDHVHQRSLWFTHGNVNGVDFWSEQEGHGTIKHREFLNKAASGDTAMIATVNDWLGPDGAKQCEDERRLSFRADGDRRVIDFDITVKATAGPVTFGDTKEGSMGIRVPTVMDVNSEQGGHIQTSEGLTDRDAWGKPAAWVDYHGPLDGQMVGVAILNHPSSFRFPTTWHVRDYGLFAANPFGLSDFQGSDQVDGSQTIAANDSMALRYRIVFHKGDAAEAGIAEQFEAYAQEAK